MRLARENYYLISYDLDGATSEEYAAVQRIIEKELHGVRILRTVWLIYVPRNIAVDNVAVPLRAIMRDEDKMIVVRLGKKINPHNFNMHGCFNRVVLAMIGGLREDD